MTVHKLVLLVLTLSLATLCSCAAVFNNDFETVLVETEPPGATLSLNGQVFGKTPAKMQLAHDETVVLLVELPGYEPASATIGKHVGIGWLVVDIIFIPTLIPILVDAIGGSWYELDSNELFFKLSPGGGPAKTNPVDRPRDDGRPVSQAPLNILPSAS